MFEYICYYCSYKCTAHHEVIEHACSRQPSQALQFRKVTLNPENGKFGYSRMISQRITAKLIVPYMLLVQIVDLNGPYQSLNTAICSTVLQEFTNHRTCFYYTSKCLCQKELVYNGVLQLSERTNFIR